VKAIPNSLKGNELKKKKAVSKSRNAKKAKKTASRKRTTPPLELQAEVLQMRKSMQKLWELLGKTDERVQDIEIHVNLITRLITTLCIEKFGMRIGVLKRMIKRIEKEAIRDSQILHLEELYKLPPHSDKKSAAPQPPSKNDPWEEIS
jgi:hypothetical protein